MSADSQSNQSSAPTPSAPAMTLQDHLEAAAKSGDFSLAVDAIAAASPADMNLTTAYALLWNSVQVASCKSPQRFTDAIFRKSIAFTEYVTLRLQVLASRCLADLDRGTRPGEEDWPKELQAIIPELRSMMALTMQLTQSWASNRRMWELSRRKRPARSSRNRRKDPFEDLYN